MFNKTSIAFLFSFFTFIISISAQSKFVAGSITKNNGEVVNGEIDYGKWTINPRTIQFRTSSKSSPQTFSCKDLVNFKLNELKFTFVSSPVEVDYDPLDDDEKLFIYETHEDAHKGFKPKSDTVFLKLMVGGKANLYELHDEKNKVHYFAQKDKGEIKELNFRRYKVFLNTFGPSTLNQRKEAVIVEGYIYRQQISTLLSDAKRPVPTHSMRYSYEIVEAFKKYNEEHHDLDYVTKPPKAEFSTSVYGGLNYAQARFKNAYHGKDYLTMGSSINPIVGYTLGWELKGTNHNIKFGLDFSATRVSSIGSTSENFLGRSERYEFKSWCLRAMPFAEYVLSKKWALPVTPYTKLGVMLAYYTTKNLNYAVMESGKEIPGSEDYDLFQKELTIMAGLGFKFNNKTAIEMRYEPGVNLSPYFDSPLEEVFKYNRYLLVFNYSF